MNFGKLILLATILAATTHIAKADTITTTSSGGNFVNITSTGITFLTSTGTPPEQAGLVGSTHNGIFSVFPTGTVMDYTPNLAAVQANAAMHFFYPAFADAPTLASPVHFYEIISGGNTLELYLTNVVSRTVGATGVTGGFSATGYITETGIPSNINVTFSLAEISTGTGAQAFTTTLNTVAPEPSSITFLGTGILAAAGMFRKRRTV